MLLKRIHFTRKLGWPHCLKLHFGTFQSRSSLLLMSHPERFASIYDHKYPWLTQTIYSQCFWHLRTIYFHWAQAEIQEGGLSWGRYFAIYPCISYECFAEWNLDAFNGLKCPNRDTHLPERHTFAFWQSFEWQVPEQASSFVPVWGGTQQCRVLLLSILSYAVADWV